MKSITLGVGKHRRKYRLLVHDAIDGSIDCPQRQYDLYIDPRTRGKRLHLETAIHEGIHGECPYLGENVVSRLGRNLGRLVWGLGYRLQEENDA